MVVKPIDSDFTSVNNISKGGPVIEDDESYIFGTTTNAAKAEDVKVSKPEEIKNIDLNLDDDFDIVIDTGTDTPTLENTKKDGGAITETYETPVIDINNDDNGMNNDDSIV